MSTALQPAKAGPTVLLVEDEEMLRRMLSRILRDRGFRVLEAENGEAALQLVGGLSRPPGLLLTDITMPVLDGLQLARIFGSRYPSVPIMFMSGAMPRLAPGHAPLVVGARLLLKPFDPDVFLEAVTAALDHERRSISRAHSWPTP